MVIATSSSQESNLRINWTTLLNDTHNEPDNHENESGLSFESVQDASIGLLLEKVIIFDDINGDGIFNSLSEPHRSLNMSSINWDLASNTTFFKDDFLKTYFRMREQIWGGNLIVRLGIPRDYKADRQKEVPHLKLSSQSISMVIVIDGMQAPREFTASHLHLSFVVVVQSPSNGVDLVPTSESLISDDYSPGAFRIKSLQFEVAKNSHDSSKLSDESSFDHDTKPKSPVLPNENLGFFYWKEVAYTDKRKLISRTIDVSDSEEGPLEFNKLRNLTSISPPFYQYFKVEPKKEPYPTYRIYRFELNFGRNDTYYNSSNFVDFSFVFGLGTAPQEQMFSFLVKIIIFICFCLPIVVMIAGIAYLMLKRFSQHSDTELLLAADT